MSQVDLDVPHSDCTLHEQIVILPEDRSTDPGAG
jgi:hypothetical protein